MQTGMRQQGGSVISATRAPVRLDGPGTDAEWLSAFMDGEAEDYPDSLRQAGGMADWDAYHLIGDVLRSPGTAQVLSPGFSARVAAAIAAEPAIVAAPRRTAMRRRRFVTRYGLPGLAAAAAVASVTWMAHPYFAPAPVAAPAMASAQRVDPAVRPVADRQQSVQFGEYLDAHRQYSGQASLRQVSVSVGSPAQR